MEITVSELVANTESILATPGITLSKRTRMVANNWRRACIQADSRHRIIQYCLRVQAYVWVDLVLGNRALFPPKIVSEAEKLEVMADPRNRFPLGMLHFCSSKLLEKLQRIGVIEANS